MDDDLYRPGLFYAPRLHFPRKWYDSKKEHSKHLV